MSLFCVLSHINNSVYPPLAATQARMRTVINVPNGILRYIFSQHLAAVDAIRQLLWESLKEE